MEYEPSKPINKIRQYPTCSREQPSKYQALARSNCVEDPLQHSFARAKATRCLAYSFGGEVQRLCQRLHEQHGGDRKVDDGNDR